MTSRPSHSVASPRGEASPENRWPPASAPVRLAKLGDTEVKASACQNREATEDSSGHPRPLGQRSTSTRPTSRSGHINAPALPKLIICSLDGRAPHVPVPPTIRAERRRFTLQPAARRPGRNIAGRATFLRENSGTADRSLRWPVTPTAAPTSTDCLGLSRIPYHRPLAVLMPPGAAAT